jgi:hypothetical protein
MLMRIKLAILGEAAIPYSQRLENDRPNSIRPV